MRNVNYCVKRITEWNNAQQGYTTFSISILSFSLLSFFLLSLMHTYHVDGQKNRDLMCAPALSRPRYRRARGGSRHYNNSVFGAHGENAALDQYFSQCARRVNQSRIRQGLVTSILSDVHLFLERGIERNVVNSLVMIVRHDRPETS